MKTKITALALVAVTALSLAPKPAKAGDKEWAVVGGILGGIIIGSAIHEASKHDYPARSTTVISHDRDDRCDDRGSSGYWTDVRVKVWVPGCWVVEHRHGHRTRRYVGGHYDYRTDRIWVSTDRHDRNGSRDRHVSSGYGRGR